MTKASSASLSEQAANEMMDMIVVEHRFQPGDKLPNEMELAQELGISRITLREAVRVLCTRGLVEIRRGKGTYVLSSVPNFAGGTEAPFLEAAGVDFRDLLEIRMVVEPMAAFYAAKRATEEEIRRIDELRLDIENLAARQMPFLKEEQEFHNAIALASQNQLMRRLMPIINRSIYADLTCFKESVSYSLQDHREIVHYIRARNPEGARTIMRMHIVHVYQMSGQEIE